jgi:hypothetical protein
MRQAELDAFNRRARIVYLHILRTPVEGIARSVGMSKVEVYRILSMVNTGSSYGMRLLDAAKKMRAAEERKVMREV